MKRLISAALALSLLGATAASAASARAPIAPVDYRSQSYRHHDNGNGAAIAAGIGFLALAAILASQNNHDRDGRYYHDRNWRDRDYGYRPYDQGYGNRGYGYSAPYGGYRGW